MSVNSSLLPTRVPHLLFVVLPALLGLTLVPGCSDSDTYSEAVQFRVRTDPFFSELPTVVRYEPDPPGVLPLKSMKQKGKLDHLFPATPNVDSKLRDPTKISDADKDAFEDTLNRIFGSPAKPTLNLKGTDAVRMKLKLSDPVLQEGSRLYRLNCMQCHGVTGDGRGPTAQWINPHPRDYRLGKFKFQSTNLADVPPGQERKPLRDDLHRIIHNGAEGTAMPAFNLLENNEKSIEAIVSYVILLSIRGEAEYLTFKQMESDNNGQLSSKSLPKKIPAQLEFLVRKIAGQWADSQDEGIKAAPYPYAENAPAPKDSIERGYAMFLGDEAKIRLAFSAERLEKMFPDMKKTEQDAEKLQKAKIERLKLPCMSCHTDYGRQAPYKFDDWGTLVRPTNLISGVYRGGRRPIDLYWRIHSGIPGAGMAVFGSAEAGVGGDQIWDLVNFVRTLPYREMMKNQYHIEVR